MTLGARIRFRIFLPLVIGILAGTGPSGPEEAFGAPRPGSGAALVASPSLPVDDPAYDDLDRLDALGYLPREILGHRPMSLLEVTTLLDTAERALAERTAPAVVHEIVARLRLRFPAADAAGGPAHYALAAATLSASDQPPRVIPRINGLGGIEGSARPFYADQGGGPWSADGTTGVIQAGGGRSFGPRLAGALCGELRALDGADDSPTVMESDSALRPRLRGVQVRFKQANIIFELGRQDAAWGPRPGGGFLLSRNTRPLDLAQVMCERPWHFPGFLRYVGPVRQSLLLADLGGARNLSHARLFAVRQSFRVTRHLELGFTETLVFGGSGAPKLSFGDFLYEVIPVGGRNGRRDLSDHRYGMDGRVEIWPGRLLAYGDVFVDDSRAPLYEYFHTLLAKRLGLAAPAFGPGGRWEARAEYAHVPAIAYRHGRWFSGYTVDGRVLGDELGPDARGLRFEVAVTLPAGHRVAGEYSYERRDADTWAQEPSADPDRAERIYRAVDRPGELRRRLMVTGRFQLTPQLDLRPRAGLERLTGALDVRADGTDQLLEVGLEFRPLPD